MAASEPGFRISIAGTSSSPSSSGTSSSTSAGTSSDAETTNPVRSTTPIDIDISANKNPLDE